MILIIAKNRSDYAQLVEFFHQKGISTKITSTYAEAIEQARAAPQLQSIVAEYDLGLQNAFQVFERIHSFGISVPTFLIVEKAAQVELKVAFEKGVEAIFKKPLELASLANSIFEALVNEPTTELQRKPSRVWSNLRVEFEASRLTGKFKTVATNLSLGGMFLSTTGELPHIGDFIAFSIPPSEFNAFSVEGEGIVKWVRTESAKGRPAGFGIEFYLPTDEGIKMISELYNTLKTTRTVSELLEH